MALIQSFPDTELALERARFKANRDNADKQLPEYFSGARCRLLINGETIGAALEVSWSVTSEMQEIRTIDTFLPWEIVPGQMTISANLKRVVDPRRQLGSDGLYSTITSYLHQPYASIEVRDRLGNLIFLARGMFKDLQGTVANGQLGVESLNFVGYYWRENVAQEFSPVKEDLAKAALGRFTKNSLFRRVSSPFSG